MSKFNKKTTTKQIATALSKRKDATTNYHGALAFKPESELELYLVACSGFLENQTYRSGEDKLRTIQKLVAECTQEYVLKLAAYVRNKMHLRTLSLVLLAEAARHHKPVEGLVRKFVPLIIQRADEPSELLAYLWNGSDRQVSGQKIPMAIKRGLQDVLQNFSEYELAKYNRSSAGVKMRDLFRFLRPKPMSEKQATLFGKVMKNTLATPDTWEVIISTEKPSKATWNKASANMGPMAMLRNLRNFEKHGATEAIDKAVQMFTNKEAVLKSKQLPYRWYTAAKHVGQTRVRDAIYTAMDLSIEGMDKIEGSTAIFVDLSGSMDAKVSGKSEMSCREVACVMGALCLGVTTGDYLVGAYGQSYQTVNLSRRDSVITNSHKIRLTNVGHATNAYLCIEHLLKNNIRMDNVVILSDEQSYGKEVLAAVWMKYLKVVNPEAKLYSFDLTGYGQLQFPSDHPSVTYVSGWSTDSFRMITSLNKRGSAVEMIKSVPVPEKVNSFRTWKESFDQVLA